MMLDMAADIVKNSYSKHYELSVINRSSIAIARNIFNVYADSGVIRHACFDDNVWVLFDEIRTVTLDFRITDTGIIEFLNIPGYSVEKLSEYMKVYVVLRMGSLGLSTIKEITKAIKSFIFDPNMERIASSNTSAAYITDFLRSLPNRTYIDEMIERIESMDLILSKRGDKRILAEFKQYFRLDESLNSFWTQAADHDKVFFFPVWLWWQLTAILPLRPTEFLLTPRNCLERVGDEYRITVRRTLRKGNSSGRKKKTYHIDGDYDTYVYKVSDKIAHEIEWYIDFTNSEYRSSIGALFSIIPHWRYFHKTMPFTATYYTYSYLSRSLSEFQSTYMCSDTEISSIHLGDTRHIAMIGLIISGGSPSICRELAGHEDISISSHYYSNISRFVECSVYEFSRTHTLYPVEIINRDNPMAQADIRTPVRDGYCASSEYAEGRINDCLCSVGPMGELGECKRCRYFVDGKTGKYRVLADIHGRRMDVDNDSRQLISAIERVRKGIGLNEEIELCIMRLQSSVAIYAQSLIDAGKEDNYAKTEKN